ncbi:histidine kinase [Actinomycetes bacterium KLBMP 9797]
MRWVRGWLRGHPRWVDTGLAALLAAVNAPAALEPSDGFVAWLCYAAVHAPLVWRRRWPVTVFWAVLGLALLNSLIVDIRVEGFYPESVLVLAVYTAARHGPRWQLVPIVAAIEIPAIIALFWEGPNWTVAGFITSALAATVLLGLVRRTRVAYLAEREERIRRLERDRDQRARLAVAAERARIARDVHDIVAHNLAVMVALADGSALTATTAPERAADTMRKVSETGRQALAEMRHLLGLLRDDEPGRTPRPGLDDVDDLVAHVRAAGLPVALSREGVPGNWGAGAGLAVYRIVQEALTNALKHAGPRASAAVRLRFQDGSVEVEVTDDGAGRAAADHDGHGLAGMAARAATYGGQVAAGPRADGPGWRVRATLRLEGGEAT